jgi:DNA-binding LytR/AlgR family response regulator
VAEDKLTCAVTAERRYVVDASVAELEAKLAPSRFFRIHRAALVNLAFVGELEGAGAGAVLRLRDGARTELSVARDRVRALKQRLGS